jgi:hypothetical protein
MKPGWRAGAAKWFDLIVVGGALVGLAVMAAVGYVRSWLGYDDDTGE